MHRDREAPRQCLDRFAVLGRAIDDLIVDVRNIAHIGDLEAAVAQPAIDDVERHIAARMADVAVVVHGNAAHVQARAPGMDRPEILFLAAQGIMDAQHSTPLAGAHAPAKRSSRTRT